MLCERAVLLLCFVEHPECSSFKMYAVLILFFHKFVSQLFIQQECIKVTFLKFQVLRERTNLIASFPKYPVYIEFEMFSVLILGFLFWFVVTYSKSMYKSNLFFVILASFILLYHVWTKVNVWKFSFLEILGGLRKEHWYYFFHRAHCI